MRNYQRPRHSLHNDEREREKKRETLDIIKQTHMFIRHSIRAGRSAFVLFVFFVFFFVFVFVLPGCSQIFLVGTHGEILGDMDFCVRIPLERSNMVVTLLFYYITPSRLLLSVRNVQVKN